MMTAVKPLIKHIPLLLIGLLVLLITSCGSSSDNADITNPPTTPNNDTTPPVIELNGANPMPLQLGTQYIEPGAQATDETDGTVTVVITGNVDINTLGSYTIRYSANDNADNNSVVTRVVNVLETPPPTATGRVEIYPALNPSNGILNSEKYRINIQQNGVTQNSYVNKSINNHTKVVASDQPERLLTDTEREKKFKTDSNHWSSFSFVEPVTITVELLEQPNITGNVTIRPEHRAINATVTDNTVTFQVNEPGQFYVSIQGLERHPLFIFANPLPMAIPDINLPAVYTGAQIKSNPSLLNKDSLQTIYFAPGTHIISEPVFNSNGLLDKNATEARKFPTLPSNTHVYIAGGAYVKGLFSVATNVTNVHITGYGVLSGFDYPHEAGTWDNHMVSFNGYNGSTNLGVDGLTIVDGPKTCITARSGPIVINNVKCMGWHANTDGIASGNSSQINQSFFKVFDDVIKLFHSDMRINDNVIWQQQTGSAFQLSWNLSGDVSNIRVNNTDIIAVDRELGSVLQTGGSASDYPSGTRQNGNINNALINARNFKGGSISDVIFDDVRFDVQPFQLLQLQLKDYRNGFTNGTGDISNLELRNVSMPEVPRIKNYILDNGIGRINQIKLQGLSANQQPLLPADLLISETTNAN